MIKFLDLRRHGVDPGILSSEYYSHAGRRSSRWAKSADGVAGGETLFQAANCYSNALRCAARFIDGSGRTRCRWERSAGHIYETGRDKEVLAREITSCLFSLHLNPSVK